MEIGPLVAGLIGGTVAVTIAATTSEADILFLILMSNLLIHTEIPDYILRQYINWS